MQIKIVNLVPEKSIELFKLVKSLFIHQTKMFDKSKQYCLLESNDFYSIDIGEDSCTGAVMHTKSIHLEKFSGNKRRSFYYICKRVDF